MTDFYFSPRKNHIVGFFSPPFLDHFFERHLHGALFKSRPLQEQTGKELQFFFHTEISSQTTPPYNNCTSTLNSLILKHYYSFHTHLHISITSCISSRVREATLLDHKESILLDQKEFVQDSPKIVIYLLYHYNQYSKTKTYNGVS